MFCMEARESARHVALPLLSSMIKSLPSPGCTLSSLPLFHLLLSRFLAHATVPSLSIRRYRLFHSVSLPPDLDLACRRSLPDRARL